MKNENYDVIIVGAGPAGMTAAIYSARYHLKTLVIGTLVGGLASEAHRICNFPTYTEIKGFELAHKLLHQVNELGVEIKNEKVEKIHGKNNNFILKTSEDEYKCKKLIIATGSKKKTLGVEKEFEFIGRGITYCATCDAPFYKNKTVAVVGGGNAALTAALLASEFANKVYILYRKEEFSKADPAWVKLIKENKKIEVLFKTEVAELIGEKKLKAVKLNNGKIMDLDGIFIEIGADPNTEIVKDLGVELERNYIKTDAEKKTNIAGIFAAGDVASNPLKQIIVACGEGAIAADSAYREITAGK